MTRQARICQSIIIAVCLCSIAFALYGYAVTSFAHNPRISARFLLRLAVNLVFVWKIVTSPKSWSLGLGFLFVLGAVALPFIFCFPSHLLHGINFNDPAIILRHFVLPECETAISAICCFILRRELTKEVPSQPARSTQGG
jgi:membrane protein YdbS with pleckstrin-like domain